MPSKLTKRALEESLKRLLLTKPLTKITVADIAEDCGISRATFYYHFQDIYDLVEWACSEDAARALAGNKTAETWQKGLLNIFYAVRENKPFVMNVYHNVSRERVEYFLLPATRDLIAGVVEEHARNHRVREDDKRFIEEFFAHAFVGVMLDWVRDGMSEEPEGIVERIALLMDGEMELALARFSV